ncbi:MAG TPA: hypothetical protein VH062_29105 [Polyangiaceae bacterium]|jgi:hypothetical protein|nr:hypothetical protein [Polyangiaceae bacterium]
MLVTKLRDGWIRAVGRAGAVALGTFYLFGCGGDTGSSGGSCGISGCGGDIKGTWDVTEMCSSVPAPAVMVPAACQDAVKEAVASAKTVPMGLQLNFSDNVYTVTGSLEVQIHLVYTKACLSAQGATASDATCGQLATGMSSGGLMATCSLAGDTCACDATEGTPLTVNEPYTVNGTTLALGSSSGGPFCVTGDTAKIGGTSGSFEGSMTLKRH